MVSALRSVLLIGVVLVAAPAAACGDTADPDVSTESRSTSSGAVAGTVTSCPHPEQDPRNACLGPLEPGTYTTVKFHPQLTYTVPDGWANYEDLRGSFLLLPPESDIDGVDPGVSPYIGMYTSVAAPLPDCSSGPDPTVARNVDSYLAWLQDNPALSVSTPTPVTVGSHQGFTTAVSLRPGQAPCSDPEQGIDAFAEFAIGSNPSDFSASVTPQLSYQVEVFQGDPQVLLILVADPHTDGTEDWTSTAQEVIGTFQF